MENITDWINKKFLEWEASTGKKQSYQSFAAYLGIKPTTFSTWRNQNVPPSREMADQIASILGPEIYNLLGYEIDDSILVSKKIERTANQMEYFDRSKFLDEINKFIDQWLQSNAKRIK